MKENDIRKRETFDRYLELVKKDCAVYFDKSAFITVACPACGSISQREEFEKSGFMYVTCNDCATLFVNPRPPQKMLSRFYTESPSTSYWINEFFKPVAEARREKIFKPRAAHIGKYIEKGRAKIIGDIGAGFGIFLEELRKIIPDLTCVAIEPSQEMAQICRDKGLIAQESSIEALDGFVNHFDILCSFELLEHLFDIRQFMEKARNLLCKGGLLYLTTLNAMGFDILTLREKSKSVSPPHHLNFLNPRSITLLAEKTGFTVEALSTPGELDWSIVEGMYYEDNIAIGHFWEYMAAHREEECKKEFQEWLKRHKLSSHMRVLLRKR
ncbi:MAG: class I SAM-dependent methyltransferase [Candidatus Eremiobacteraeota bacterium]|nr:class I SAM-dependent methyltransferase [Candidatus Eremiobacteraeota bacterium]